MLFREDYIEPLRACLADADDWYDVERCFQSHVTDEEIDDGRPVVYAFGYMLVEGGREALRERTGVFAPRIEWDNGRFPEFLDDVPDEMIHVWASYADALGDDPIAASRLHDLLWIRRHGDAPIEHARAAGDAYLALADRWESMRLVESLSRALELGVETNDAQRLEAAIRKTIAAIKSEMATDEWRPGVPLRLLARLVDLRPARRPAELPALLEATAKRYGADPHIAESVAELQAALAGAGERERLHRELVERWRAEARNASGLLRYAHLQRALEIARTRGFADAADEILGELQSMTPEDLELSRVSSEVSVPREGIEAYIESLAGAGSSWRDALEAFGAEGPPSGAVEEVAGFVDELARQHPVTRLFPKQVLGEHSSTIYRAVSDEEHRKLDIAEQLALRIRWWAPIGAAIVAEIEERYGTPDRADLQRYFTTELIDEEVAARLGDGLLRFYAGDDEGALHVLVPQVEAAIRGLAARVGVTVIRNPQGERPGGVIPLGGVLASLHRRLDESWRQYFLNALVDPLGVNLRNRVSHGLQGPVGRGDVAIALHIACHLRLLRAAPPEGSAAGS